MSNIYKLPLPQRMAPSVREPHFAIVTTTAEARLWTDSVLQHFALWQQGHMDWLATHHACIHYGPSGTGETSFPATVANRLGISRFEASWPQWEEPLPRDAVSTVAAIVNTFDEAIRRTPCVLSLPPIPTSFPSDQSSLYHTAVTSALLAEIDDALRVPGLVLIVMHDNCLALAQALLPTHDPDRLMAVPLSPAAEPANDNAPDPD